MTTLFLSYPGTISALATGKVSESDLADAVFFFDCCESSLGKTEVHELAWLWDNSDHKATVQKTVMKAIHDAKAKGRADIRQFEYRGFRLLRNFQDLAAVLDAAGINIRGWEEIVAYNAVTEAVVEEVFRHFGIKAKIFR